MGNDGGTIARRSDLLSLHSKGSTESNKEYIEDSDDSKLVTCVLSSLPLYNKGPQHIASDYKGNLFLKDKILEYIINNKEKKQDQDSKFNHIRTLNDLVDIHITWRIEEGNPIIECPVTNIQGGKKSIFAYLRPCGCVLAFRFLDGLSKHLKTTDKPVESECPNCRKEIHFDYDIVILNPMNDDAYTLYNQRNKDYLNDVLDLSHAKKPKKHKKSKIKSKRKSPTETDHSVTKKCKIEP